MGKRALFAPTFVVNKSNGNHFGCLEAGINQALLIRFALRGCRC